MSSMLDQPALWDFVVQPVDRLLTAADLAALPEELPSGPVSYELDNGRLVLQISPPGDIHGATQSLIATYLTMHGQFAGHGEVRTETAVVLWRNPDRVVAPDVAFLAARSLPVRTSPEGYLETIPQLAVEIRSKNDSQKFIDRKVEHYLQAGVATVWVVDPHAKTVLVHAKDAEPSVVPGDQSLTLPGLIPDFSLPLADIFRR